MEMVPSTRAAQRQGKQIIMTTAIKIMTTFIRAILMECARISVKAIYTFVSIFQCYK